MHEFKGSVDVFKAHDMGDHRVDLDLAGHIHVDDLGHIGAALGPAKGRAAPVAAGDKLERTGPDFLARFSATPMMMLVPQPRWQASKAVRMTSVLPVASNV